MPYPETPFTEHFDNHLINSLLCDKIKNDSIKDSSDQLRKTLKWLCTSPNITSLRVNSFKESTEKVVQILTNHFKSIASKAPKIYVHPFLYNTIIIENEEMFQKQFTKYQKEIIIDTDCGSAVLRGANIYAPGVLGMTSGCQLDDDVSIYSDLSKKCKKGLQKIYTEGEKLFIGNGKIKMQRHHLFGDKLVPNGVAVEITETISGCFPISENILPQGCVLLQNLPSIICVQELNPQPGDVIIDMCASPGNKTTHIAELMQNKGILIAIDKTPRKVAVLKSRCDDFGCTNVYTFEANSTCIHTSLDNMRTVTDGPPFASETFDKILLDAPCSVLGKRPQLVNRMSEKEIKSYVPLQRKLFETAVSLLKPGGRMVYSTCTITLAENEGMVAWALRKFQNLELEKPHLCLGESGWKGTSLTDEDLRRVQRFGPDSKIDSVGFFFACFTKK